MIKFYSLLTDPQLALMFTASLESNTRLPGMFDVCWHDNGFLTRIGSVLTTMHQLLVSEKQELCTNFQEFFKLRIPLPCTKSLPFVVFYH